MPTPTAAPTTARYRPLEFGITRARLERGDQGQLYLDAEQPLAPYAHRMTDRLLHWAQTTPNASYMAERQRLPDGSLGDWQHITYAQALAKARSIGQALLTRGLSAERPVLILSDNSLDHAMLMLGCMVVGVPYSSTSPAYSLLSQDFNKLRHVMQTLTPGLIWADDGARYAPAIAAVASADVAVCFSRNAAQDLLRGHPVCTFDELLATPATAQVDEAMNATGPDTIVKFLFTSGSTKQPKAVINTHRMWCANQRQIIQGTPIIEAEKPVLVDWLPWNHTFGSNKNCGIVLHNGGTLYIDGGKPTPALIGETLRNLREISPTIYFNVPAGFEAIANALPQDAQLRRTFLARVKMLFYAGAALPQAVWDSLFASQEAELGERIVMASGLGMTESSPFGLFVTHPHIQSGDLGLPGAGLTVKLVPNEDKLEIRYRGPNITPGYWRNPEGTAEAFDEEGFFCSGDAVAWIDPDNIHLGLRFDGRIAEDFKLTTGTFVSVGPLRARVIAAGTPYIQDVVITGLNRSSVGALIFPTPAVRELAADLPADAPMAQVLEHPAVLAKFHTVVQALVASATGSANRVSRLMLMHQSANSELGEITDKGSLNQRAVLRLRDDCVQALYTPTAGYTVITAEPPATANTTAPAPVLALQ